MLLALTPDNVTAIAEIHVFRARPEINHRSEPATLTVCRLLGLLRQSDPENLGGVEACAAEPAQVVFQINHARVLEPKSGDNVFAKETDKLWPSVRVADSTGNVEVRMRKKAALELSGAPDAATFAD